MVLTEGWDVPPVSCCILARPTKKMGLYRQMVGRVLRPADGKADAIVLDHSGATYRHGFVEDQVEWILYPDRRAISPAHRERGERGSRLVECKNCGVVRVAGEACWHCGYLPQQPAKAVEIKDGELGLVGRDRHAHGKPCDPAERARWHAMLLYIGIERGYERARGWAAHKYKDKFGEFPKWGVAPRPIPPTPEVRSYVRSRDIAYAKRRAAS
jgi:hypothetical protein